MVRTLLSLLLAGVPLAACGQRSVTVPFVGCPADGQVGPVAAPRGRPRRVALHAASALRLAYYKGPYAPGVLGPRGWHCFVTYGSNGASVFVAPTLPPTGEFFSSNWRGFTGPVIQLSSMDGGTSGRFSVAETIARVFPAHRGFAERVEGEHLMDKALPSGPYATDTLRYVSQGVVEFTTPGGTKGLGTDSRLLPSEGPITGVEILQAEEPNVISVAVRLPPDAADLGRLIVHQVEKDNPTQESK